MMETVQSTDAARIVKYRLAGEVQQVGFRNFLRNKAQEFDLSGFVANEPDGSLIVLFAGKDDQIGKMQPLLHQGPPSARVVAVTELEPDEEDQPPADGGFVIR